MSTGAHELAEVGESVSVLRETDAAGFVLLQCVAAYPTPLESINVRVVETLRNEFDALAGLSDHTLDPVTAPSAAVALGAAVVEKHFTLDKSMEGPDHQFALEPDELDEMISAIRRTERALGTREKTVLDVESELHEIARRHVHAIEDIPAGATFTQENIAVLRSGKQEPGLHSKFYGELLGLTARRDIEKDDGVTWEDVDQ
jgi:N-acetylneuraminate synthase